MEAPRKITVRVDPETHRALKVRSAESGEAMQQILLRLLRVELQRGGRR
jgi:predicted HicB family RNase H-like nuclease